VVVDWIQWDTTVGYNGYAAKWLDIDRYRDIGRNGGIQGNTIIDLKYRYRRNIQKIHSRGGKEYIHIRIHIHIFIIYNMYYVHIIHRLQIQYTVHAAKR